METIVDAAEDVARDIRAQAESDALLYAQAKREEADRIVETRRHELAEMHSAMTKQAQVVQAEIATLAEQISSFLVTQATQASPGLTAGPLASGSGVAASPAPEPTFPDPPEPTYAAPVESTFSAPSSPVEPTHPVPSEPSVQEGSERPAWTDRPLPDEQPPSLEASLSDDPLLADPVAETDAETDSGTTSKLVGSAPPPGGVAEEGEEPTAYDGIGTENESAEPPRPRFNNPFRRSSSVTEEGAGAAVPTGDAEELPSESAPSDADAPGGFESMPANDSSPVTPAAGSRRDPDAAILMATQMAVAGSSRAEVRTTLLREFDMADAESAIVEVLGPEST